MDCYCCGMHRRSYIPFKMKHYNTIIEEEDRGTEDKRQETEDRRQKTEDRRQETRDRRQKLAVGSGRIGPRRVVIPAEAGTPSRTTKFC